MAARAHRVGVLFTLLALLAGALCTPAGADAPPQGPWLAKYTTTELASVIAAGTDTVIVPTGGIEQNGPHVALDKHDLIVSALSERMAASLGHTLIAPVVSFVPEGDIVGRTQHMAYAGTLSARESTFRALLHDIVQSLQAHGFRRVLLIGDSAGNQGGLADVARDLDSADARVLYVPKVYDYDAVRAFLKTRGFVETAATVHEELAFSAQLAAVAPEALRVEARTKDGVWSLNGVSMSVAALGALGTDILAKRSAEAVAEVRQLSAAAPTKAGALPLALTPLRAFVDTADRLYVLHFGSAFVLAAAVFALRVSRRQRRTSMLAFLFPRGIWLHPSARLDYLFWALNMGLLLLLPVSFGVAIGYVSRAVQGGVGWLLPPLSFHASATVLSVAYTSSMLLAADFALFVAHYLQHKVPALWEFHAVHHSAEVLTPFTMLRMHPLDSLLNFGLSAIAIAAVDGAFAALFSGGYRLWLIGSINALWFAFHFAGYHLRHSHVWLSYGAHVSRWLMSPAQHQLHHSRLVQHHDRNFGVALACWDALFGTLYVPTQREPLTLGIEGRERDFLSLRALYFEPIRRVLDKWLVSRK